MKRKMLKKISAAGLAGLIAAVSVTAAIPSVSAAESGNPTFATEFKDPSGTAKPFIRWWVMPGMMTEEETKREVRQMADTGFGGIELVAISTAAPFGSDGWNQCMQWALEEALDCGIQLDFTIGQGWPVKTPAISNKDDIRTEQGLFYKNVDFTATAENMSYKIDQIPFPDEQFETERPYELVAVTAAKQVDGVYDPNSAIDITLSITGMSDNTDVSKATLNWTAPEQGNWTIFYLYRQAISTASQWGASDPIVDHFNKDATQAVLDYWENTVMAGDLKGLYEQNGGNIFCDSLELGQASKDKSAFWTANLLEEFKTRRGYDLTPYLPAIFMEGFYPYYSHTKGADAASDFNFGTQGTQIREDFYQTLTELFTENHVAVIRNWAHTHNMQLRYQVYGDCMEVTEASLATDIVETESWGHFDNKDMYRTQSGVVHMTGSNIYSTESSAVKNLAWAQTWTGSHRADKELDENGNYWPTDGTNYVYPGGDDNLAGADVINEDAGLLYHYNRELATGVNRIVMHGFSYHSNLLQQWPGDSFMAMGGFPNEWDDKTPMWNHIDQMTDYLARTQYVMQKGQADIDLAIYRKSNYERSEGFDWALNELEKAGYTYDFAAPALLDLDNAVTSTVNGKTVLAADGPSYKALVLDQRYLVTEGQEKDGLTASSMPVATAEKILSYAKAGLPIVIVGEAPSKVGSFCGSDKAMNAENAKLAEIMAEIEALSTTKIVATKDNVPAALSELGVSPDVQKDNDSALLNFHRTDADADYYYLYNSDLNEEISQTISLQGEGTPYLLDPWSGEITQVAEYIQEDGKTTIPVDLKANENMLIALAKDTWTGASANGTHITKTNADSVGYQDGTLVARTSKQGNYTFDFSNGTSSTVEINAAQQPITLNHWTMNLESWSAGDTALETKKENLGPYELDELVPWNEIEGLEDVAGVATYNTSFELENGWEQGQGAMISFTRVSDTMKLKVNGTEVPVNQLSNTIDIGKYLVKGTNNITVEVTSNLANIKTERTQEFGIIGDVTVTPYVQTTLEVPEPEQPTPSDPSNPSTPSETPSETPSNPSTPSTSTPTTGDMAFPALIVALGAAGATALVIAKRKKH